MAVDNIARMMALDAAKGGGGSDSYTKAETNALLDEKVSKITGKGLSTNDYTDAEKSKLAGIETEANKTIVDTMISPEQTNPVQGKVILQELDRRERDFYNPRFARLLNSGSKNLVKPPQSSGTIPGVEVTVNANGSITFNGIYKGSTFATYVFGAPLLPAGSYRLSGCPAGGSTTTFELSCGGGGLAKVTDFGSGAAFSLQTETQLTYIQIVVRSGTEFNNVTFYPMICTADDYQISPAYAPYAPTNRELYEMIQALQNGG